MLHAYPLSCFKSELKLEGIMLHEISQSEEDNYMVSLTCGI